MSNERDALTIPEVDAVAERATAIIAQQLPACRDLPKVTPGIVRAVLDALNVSSPSQPDGPKPDGWAEYERLANSYASFLAGGSILSPRIDAARDALDAHVRRMIGTPPVESAQTEALRDWEAKMWWLLEEYRREAWRAGREERAQPVSVDWPIKLHVAAHPALAAPGAVAPTSKEVTDLSHLIEFADGMDDDTAGAVAPQEQDIELPAILCVECGNTGWVSVGRLRMPCHKGCPDTLAAPSDLDGWAEYERLLKRLEWAVESCERARFTSGGGSIAQAAAERVNRERVVPTRAALNDHVRRMIQPQDAAPAQQRKEG